MFSNKLIAFVLLSVTAIASLMSIYFTTIETVEYRKNISYIKKTYLINHLNTLLDNLAKEKICTSLYLAEKNRKSFSKLVKERQAVTLESEAILKLFKNKYFQQILVSIDNVRVSVDKNNKDYEEVLLRGYEKAIEEELKKQLNRIVSQFSDNYKNVLKNYLYLLEKKANLNRENGLIVYHIQSMSKMKERELIRWSQLISKDSSPKFQPLRNIVTLTKLHQTLNSLEDESIKNRTRATFFEGVTTGEYDISVSRWLYASNIKIEKFSKAQEVLFHEIIDTLNYKVMQFKDTIFNYVFLTVFLLVMTTLLAYWLKKIKEHDLQLRLTLQGIEKDLNELQRLEIHEVLKKNNSLEIYQFLARAIKEPHKAKDYFLANMSHEVRTPLNGIMGFTTILRSTELTSEQREYLDIIEESSESLLKVINDVLDFAKVRSGTFRVDEVIFNLVDELKQKLAYYRKESNKKSIDFTLNLDPSLPIKVLGDSEKVFKVLSNLLNNAIKFTPNQGAIVVSVSPVLNLAAHNRVKIRFSVKDSGVGISKKEQEKIFDAFLQADVSSNREFGGMGLGLAISRRLIEQMGGELTVESKEGEGSIFSFDLSFEIVQMRLASVA
jgi:signal transduction histidine kinase